MKKVFKKIIGILIVCGLILSGLPSQTAYAADTGVSFVLGTNGGSGTGDTVKGDTGKDNGNTGGTTDIPTSPACDHDFLVVTLAG